MAKKFNLVKEFWALKKSYGHCEAFFVAAAKMAGVRVWTNEDMSIETMRTAAEVIPDVKASWATEAGKFMDYICDVIAKGEAGVIAEATHVETDAERIARYAEAESRLKAERRGVASGYRIN